MMVGGWWLMVGGIQIGRIGRIWLFLFPFVSFVLQSLKTVFSQRVSHVVIFITHSLKMDNTTKYAVSTFQLFEVREYPVV